MASPQLPEAKISRTVLGEAPVYALGLGKIPEWTLDSLGDINIDTSVFPNATYRIDGIPITTGGGGATPPAGNLGELQFNAGGSPPVFGATPQMLWSNNILEITGTVRSSASMVPPSGAGIELRYSQAAQTGVIGSVNRDTPAYTAFQFQGNPIHFFTGPNVMSLSDTGVGIGVPSVPWPIEAPLHVRGDFWISPGSWGGSKTSPGLSIGHATPFSYITSWDGSDIGGVIQIDAGRIELNSGFYGVHSGSIHLFDDGMVLRIHTGGAMNDIIIADATGITFVGNITMWNLTNHNPGAGSHRLWYDPADGNRVKFAA